MRLAALILIVLAGLGLRLGAAWDGSPENLPDSEAYERLARGVAEEGRFEQVGPGLPNWTQPATNYSPGLPLILGGTFVVSGSDDPRLARLLLALIGAIAIPLAWVLGRNLSGDVAGFGGAILTAFYPTSISDSGMILTEGVAGTLTIGALVVLFRAWRSDRIVDWITTGALIGLAALVRPEFLLIGILIALVVAGFTIRRDGVRLPSGPLVLLLTCLVIIVPWTVRNAAELDRFVPISTGGGQVLFTGSYLSTDGDPQRLLPELEQERPGLFSAPELREKPPPEGEDPPPDQVLAVLAARTYPDLPTDAALARIGREQYLEALIERPIALAGFLASKAGHVWLRGRAEFTGSLGGSIAHRLIVLFALLGLVGLARSRPFEFGVLITLVLTVTAIGVVLVASPRRALAIWPTVSVLAGCGIALTGSVLRGLYRRRFEGLPLP